MPIYTLFANRKMQSNWPKISVVVFSFNDEEGVKKALDSVKRQVYPKDKIEIIVIDNGSKDNSAKVAREFTSHVWIDPSRDSPAMRANGIRRATADFVYVILEQDMEMVSSKFLKLMIKPLLKEEQLVASFTREYSHSDQPWITRFISYDSVQRDPLLQFLTPSIEDTIVERKPNYMNSYFRLGKIPPVTHMLFRRSYLEDSLVWYQARDFDHDTIVRLVESGYHLFAYVPKAGIYHHHARSLSHLISKRIRNLNNHYFPYHKTTKYSYITGRGSLFMIFFAVLFANLLLPATIRGLIRFVRHRDWVLLMDPWVTLLVTDTVLWAFLTDRRGRSAIFNILVLLFKRRLSVADV